jgi:hypothetical protein
VEHHNHIRAVFQSLGITAFLIAAISSIFRMYLDDESQAPRHFGSLVAAVIVHQDGFVYDVGNFADCSFERLRSVISRQDYDDAFPVDQE